MSNASRVVPRSPWSTFAVVAAGAYLGGLGTSSVPILLPLVQSELDVPIDRVAWIVTAYVVTLTVLLLPAGRLGDRRGHRTAYVVGFLVLAIGSLASSVAPSFALLVASRVVQAAGAAVLTANGPALLMSSFPASRRGRVLGLQATLVYAGLTTGPAIAGLVARHSGWRAALAVVAPIAIVAAFLAMRSLPREVPAARPSSAAASPALLRSSAFSLGLGAAVLQYVVVATVTLVVPFELRALSGLDVQASGWVLSVHPAVMMATAVWSGALADRIGTRVPATIGMAILAIGVWRLYAVNVAASAIDFVAPLALVGLGAGLFTPANNSSVIGAAPAARQGIAGGMMGTARNVGMAMGAVATGAMLHAPRIALAGGVLVAVAGALLSLVRPAPPREPPAC